MIKWALFAVPPGQTGEFLLGEHDFGSPILLHGLEIHAHPDTDVDSLAELYVMQEDQPILLAPERCWATARLGQELIPSAPKS